MTCEGEESVYIDAEYTNNEVIFRHEHSRNQLPSVPPRNATGEPGKRSFKKIWRIIAITLGVTTIVLLATVIALTVSRTTGNSMANDATKHASGQENNAETVATSCDELRKRGSSRSGIYVVKPDGNSLPIEIYCDMETDGGGWSLVASIHESDIRRKCYSDDFWSSYVPEYQMTESGKTNWDNEMTFGTAQKCAEEDYKNIAYHSLNASDLMVWHVQLGFHVDQIRTRSTFRYRTNGKFLQKYGGNLKNLFDKYYPLKIKTDNVESKILNAIIAQSEEIKSRIPNWYNYVAGTGNTINDDTMYNSYGSRIYFRSPRRSYGYLAYGQRYRFYESHSTVSSSVSNRPLVVVGKLQNEDATDSYYEIQVYSTATHVSGNTLVPELEGKVTQGNFVLQYKAIQFPDASKNTPCEMFFMVSNAEEWKSIEPTSFRRTYAWYYNNYRYTTYRIDGSPKKMIFGYILLASKIGNNFTTEQLDDVSREILQAVSATKDVFRVSSIDNTLTVPVVFDKGSIDDVVNTIPPEYRPYVEGGYLQFRAYNYTGYASAICPGIKVASMSPEYVCIGGVSGDIGQYGTCGDFAGWGGKSTDTVLASQPSGSAHSHKDTLSTILLFYR